MWRQYILETSYKYGAILVQHILWSREYTECVSPCGDVKVYPYGDLKNDLVEMKMGVFWSLMR